jgi:C4-dicarboxylate-specific signal transduction histidine kinase
MIVNNKKISINVKKKKDTIELFIKDNAGGIDKEDITTVFEPYFSTKQEKHGVGLGLYITKNIVELHLKGSISISSSAKTTSVRIALPLIN